MNDLGGDVTGGCGGILENRRDLRGLVELARGDLHDQTQAWSLVSVSGGR